MMVDELKKTIAAACKHLFGIEIEPELERTSEEFGDYATNVALQLAGKLDKSPREIADQLVAELKKQGIEAKVAGPGFINLTLDDETLWRLANSKPPKNLAGQEILVEFGDPNPFKEMHIGHLYSYIVGDSICRLLESAGADVKRLSYHGDVGLHVAKTLWAVKAHSEAAGFQLGDAFTTDTIMGGYYAEGAQAYDKNPVAKEEIDKINLLIYSGDDPQINNIYEKGRQLSFKAFDAMLDFLGIYHSDKKRYLESQSAGVGRRLVEQNIGKVFTKSDGAIVYNGEKDGLHTRVFITSKNLPTYETKDLGLTELKNRDYPNAEHSIIITASEQAEYFKVMLAALSKINPGLAAKTKHVSHGFLSLSSGKMSSRMGNVYSATDLLSTVSQEVLKSYPQTDSSNKTDLSAVKYGFLKHRLGGDIVYDVAESINLQGNSGPYLQYAHARACSILVKASPYPQTPQGPSLLQGRTLQEGERRLVRKISEYPEVVAKATAELMPHYICTYLYELAQTFNQFYEKNRVIDDPRETFRLKLVRTYSQTLKNGLNLLGIEAPEKM